MAHRKTSVSVASFGPQLLALLIEGGKRRIVIPPPGNPTTLSWGQAAKIRFRLFQLRKCMQDEKHPMYTVASRVGVRVRWGAAAGFEGPEPELRKTRSQEKRPVAGTPCRLVIEPEDSDLADLIAAAGVDLSLGSALHDTRPPPLAPNDSGADTAVDDAAGPSDLEKLMGDNDT